MAPYADHADVARSEFRDYLGVLRRRRSVIVISAISVVATVLVLSYRQTPVYRASVDLLLRSTPSEKIVGNQSVNDVQREVTNELQVIESDAVRTAVRADTGRSLAPGTVAATIGEEGSDVIRLSAVAGDPREAATLANDYARSYVKWRRQQRVADLLATGQELQAKLETLQGRIDEISKPLAELDRIIATAPASNDRSALVEQRTALADQLKSKLAPAENELAFYRQTLDELQLTAKLAESGGLQVLSTAMPPAGPVSPTPDRDGLVALAVGLLLGLALAFVFEFLDDSIKDSEDLELGSGGLPVLALIPRLRKSRRSGTALRVVEPTSNVAEAYRALRTSLGFLSAERPTRIVQITSPSAGEGKTTTVANLALSLAQAGERVVVVGCDLRRPRLHEYFGVGNEIGLTSGIVGQASAEELLQTVGDKYQLRLLASGPIPPNPSELLGTRRTEQIIRAVASGADVVLLDCTPVLSVTDALVVSRLADATLLVAAANRTSKRQLHRAIDLLRQADAPLVGTVLTETTDVEISAYEEPYKVHKPKREHGRRDRRTPSTVVDQPAPTSR